MKKKLLALASILFVVCFGFFLIHFRQKAKVHAVQPSSREELHGELIQSAGPVDPGVPVDTQTNALPNRRRYSKPPSVQRRMILAQLAQNENPGSLDGSMPSGTKGTAADLAKTNLLSASTLPPLNQKLPGFIELNFSVLAGYDFALTKETAGAIPNSAGNPEQIRSQIPQKVQSLDGKEIVIQGFLLPVKMDDGLAVEFLLMRNQSMCCYGVAPKINEWITVRMRGKGVKPVMDQPIAVAGMMHVGPFVENGLLTGLYELDGEKVMASF